MIPLFRMTQLDVRTRTSRRNAPLEGFDLPEVILNFMDGIELEKCRRVV